MLQFLIVEAICTSSGHENMAGHMDGSSGDNPLDNAEASSWRPERGAGSGLLSASSDDDEDRSIGAAAWDPYMGTGPVPSEGHEQDGQHTGSEFATLVQSCKQDLLTITSMPPGDQAQCLSARGYSCIPVRERGLALWHTQHITMDDVSRGNAYCLLEKSLLGTDLANHIAKFRTELHGHEHDLSQRFLYLLVHTSKESFCSPDGVERALREAGHGNSALDRKRKRTDIQEAHTVEAPCKRPRQGRVLPDLEFLALQLGLVGISTELVLQLGVEIYCECCGRYSSCAQRHTKQFIKAKMPDPDMQHLLFFLSRLLEDTVFCVLHEQLQSRVEAYQRIRNQFSTVPKPGQTKHQLTNMFRALLEDYAQHTCTAFERRLRVAQFSQGISKLDVHEISAFAYSCLSPNEVGAWSKILLEHDMEEFWLPE